jgi:hypothetical protein
VTTYLLVDSLNTFFRARHAAHRGMDMWTKVGFAIHVTMGAVNRAWRISKAGARTSLNLTRHIVLPLDKQRQR